MSKDILFDVSEDFARKLISDKKEGSGYKIINGIVKGRAQAIWFTNMDIKKRHEDLILYKKYDPKKYPKYDNYDAIEVSKTKDIPMDYDGVMGVPISFLDKYNPDQFEILGATESEGKGFSNGLWDEKSKVAQPMINQNRIYKRIFIKNKKVKI
jgi:hypothetical protein